MINQLINFSINNKLIVGLLTLALAVTGLWSMTKVPLDAVPDITNNQVQVITQAPNLGTEDIEQFVTYPVEVGMARALKKPIYAFAPDGLKRVGAYIGAATEFFRLPDDAQPQFIAQHLPTRPR